MVVLGAGVVRGAGVVSTFLAPEFVAFLAGP